MKKITIFLVALLLGMGMLAPNIWATSYDPTGAPGNLPASPATAIINNHGMMGDALFGEFYRAVAFQNDPLFEFSNVATYVSIENVSNRWVAAHVRLRSGRFSIEAIDFPILLSPRDVFWFQFYTTLDADGNSVVQIVSQDVDTIVYSGFPRIVPPSVKNFSWDGETLILTLTPRLLEEFNMLDAFKGTDELTQGYVEVFGLWSLSFPTNFGPRAGHDFYHIMAELWSDPYGATLTSGLNGYASYGISLAEPQFSRIAALDVQKDLTGHVFVGDFGTGIYMGYTMKALKDWRAGVGGFPFQFANPLSAHRDLRIRGANNAGGIPINPATIIYNYGNDAAYSDPDWATSFGPTWNDGDNWYGDPDIAGANPLVASYSLDEVDDALFKRTVASTYFNEGFSGLTYSLSVLTFPTKYLHFFFTQWPNAVGSPPTAQFVRSTLNPGTLSAGGQIGVGTSIWNLREVGLRDLSPMLDLKLPFEVNFLPIGSASLATLEPFCFLTVTDLGNIGVDPDVFPAGHFLLDRFFFVDGDPRATGDPAWISAVSIAPYLYNYFTDGLSIGVSSQMLDFEFTNYPHGRAFDPSWNNSSVTPTTVGTIGNFPFGNYPFGFLPWGGPGYGG